MREVTLILNGVVGNFCRLDFSRCAIGSTLRVLIDFSLVFDTHFCGP